MSEFTISHEPSPKQIVEACCVMYAQSGTPRPDGGLLLSPLTREAKDVHELAEAVAKTKEKTAVKSANILP